MPRSHIPYQGDPDAHDISLLIKPWTFSVIFADGSKAHYGARNQNERRLALQAIQNAPKL